MHETFANSGILDQIEIIKEILSSKSNTPPPQKWILLTVMRRASLCVDK